MSDRILEITNRRTKRLVRWVRVQDLVPDFDPDLHEAKLATCANPQRVYDKLEASESGFYGEPDPSTLARDIRKSHKPLTHSRVEAIDIDL